MESSFERPDTVTLTLADGCWVQVRKRLNTGEQRQRLQRSQRLDPDGVRRLDALEHGLSTVVAYVVDWSLTDAAGDIVPIRGLPLADLTLRLDNLRPERFKELKVAIEAHEEAMTAERAAEKNVMGGEKKSSAISPSPFVVAGASTGSES